MLALAGSLRSPSACSRRGMPQRLPYSDQLKFGMSGMCDRPCGGTTMVRGIGWSNCQYSMFTTTCTISGLPPGGSSLARALDISYATRGLDRVAAAEVGFIGSPVVACSAKDGRSQRFGQRRVILGPQCLGIDDQDALGGETFGKVHWRLTFLKPAADGESVPDGKVELR